MRRYYLKKPRRLSAIGAEKKLLSETGNPGKAYLVQTANGGIFRRRTEKGIILICANLVMMIL